MPRPVVPIARAARAPPRAPGRARGATRRSRARDPRRARATGRAARRCAASASSSPSRMSGSTTTPGPIRFTRARLRGCRPAPRAARSSRPSTTSVWPALLPPWKRTTRSARGASQSTSLPLPSSPHCAPTAISVVTCPSSSSCTEIAFGIARSASTTCCGGADAHVHEHRGLGALRVQRELHARDVDARPCRAACPPRRPRRAVVILDQQRRALGDRLEHEVVDAHDPRLTALEDRAHDQAVARSPSRAW